MNGRLEVALRQDVAAARIGAEAALRWLADDLADPLAVEVEPGETPRQAAVRELFEETGVRAELLARPGAATVRTYHPNWTPTLGLSYVAIGDRDVPLRPEDGQPAAWVPLAGDWRGYFPDDPELIRGHARWLAGT